MAKGYLSLVLHAHLPFIRHPEHESFLEENWFFEAISDTYIPMINVFDRLINDGVDFRITVSLSPSLISMLKDELLTSRYIKHLDKLIKLTELEIEGNKKNQEYHKLAVMYNERYKNAKYVFDEKYRRDLTLAYKEFQDAGKVEVITCCATHGFLPLMDLYKPAVRAQVATAVDVYKDCFGTIPKGIWLPECAYHPGHDEILAEFGIRYFFVETHGIMYGSPRPEYGVHSPYLCKSGVAAFGRDMDSSKAVWSSKEGYPGDYNYREYYRDLGFDADLDYIEPFINDRETRINLGIKYHRITGEGDHKEIYDRRAALDIADSHAGNFMYNREMQVAHLNSMMDRKPVIVSPYDAELFGHWWFEGPEWLESLLRKMHCEQDTVKTITPSGYLDLYDKFPVMTPSMSTWGYKGYNEVWLDNCNDWIYKHLHKSAELMIGAARDYAEPTDIEKRTLNQMARELLLAQSSDWAFIMKTGTFVEYAAKRTTDHVGRFLALHHQLRNGQIDEGLLSDSEYKNNIFQNIDYSIYSWK